MNSLKTQIPPKILLVRCDRIGDLLLTIPVISYLYEQWKETQLSLSLLVNKNTVDLVKNHPQLREVLSLDKKGDHRGLIGTLRMIGLLRERKFDAVFVFHPTVRVHLILFLAGIPRRVGYPVKLGRFLLTDWVIDQRHTSGMHEIENVFDFVDRSPWGKEDNARPHSYSFWMARDSQADQKIEQELALRCGQKEKPLIILHPGASDPCKCWPKESFVELGRQLKERFSFEIVVVAGPSDRSLGMEVARGIPGAIDFSGKTTLRELAALLRKSKLLISNDSGPVHMAVACGTPVLSLFGRNKAGLGPDRWRPLGERDRYLFKDIGSEEENLSAITVEEVVAVAKEILTEVSSIPLSLSKGEDRASGFAARRGEG